MAQNTASAVTSLRSLTAKFDAKALNVVTFYPSICTEVPSDGFDEEYGLLGSIPQVREWIGDRKFKELRAANYVLQNKEWEVSVPITRARIADDRLGIYDPVMEDLAQKAMRHPDSLLMHVINDAETTVGWDGQYYFDTDHSWGESGLQSNLIPFTVLDTGNITAAEFKDAFHDALAQMFGFVDDNGSPIHNDFVITQQVSLTVLCSLKLQEAATTALKSVLFGGGDTNIVLNDARVVASPLYESDVKFDLYRTDPPLRPYVFQARQPLQRMMKGDDDIEFKDVKFMTYARYNLGFGAWWNSVRTTFST